MKQLNIASIKIQGLPENLQNNILNNGDRTLKNYFDISRFAGLRLRITFTYLEEGEIEDANVIVTTTKPTSEQGLYDLFVVSAENKLRLMENLETVQNQTTNENTNV